jgi:membrane-associated phospholipid phosphatase
MDYTAFAQRHAMAIILIALAATPALGVATWRMLTRAIDACAPRARLALIALIAFATLTPVIVGAGVFIALARRLTAASPFAAADQRLLDAIRAGVPASVSPWFARLTHLGDPWFLTLMCALLCVALVIARRFGLALYLALATSAGGFIDQGLKLAMRRARPADALVPLPESFSFPSGHTFGSMVCYGMCAWALMRIAPRRFDALLIALACIVVLTIGLSRVVIGVHFPGDVLGGFAAGGAWLAACIGAAEMLRRMRGARAGAVNAR